MENFETAAAQLQARVLGAIDTTAIVGNGIDQDNKPIPFAMAHRIAKDTTFAAVFEPYRTVPRITDTQMPLPNIVHISARSTFDDWILLPEANHGERTFGAFTSDAMIAFVRLDAANHLQTIVITDATRLANGNQVLLNSPKSFTAQINFAVDSVAIITKDVISQLRLYSPKTTQVSLNGQTIQPKKDGDYIVLP